MGKKACLKKFICGIKKWGGSKNEGKMGQKKQIFQDYAWE